MAKEIDIGARPIHYVIIFLSIVMVSVFLYSKLFESPESVIGSEGCEIVPLTSNRELSYEEAIARYRDNTSYRPRYCGKLGCLEERLFALPYPKNFVGVWNLVYFGRLKQLENFSVDYPDEAYWKQPEFYADSFRRNLDYYVNTKHTSIAGFGPYPADVFVGNMTTCEYVDVISFWHTAHAAVTKYQAFTWRVEYPESGQIRMGMIRVEHQDPEVARKCFHIQIKPDYVILSPTWYHTDERGEEKLFDYNWTRKVIARITLLPGCPKGLYLIQIVPTDLPEDLQQELYRKYGLKLASMRIETPWQIFVEVV